MFRVVNSLPDADVRQAQIEEARRLAAEDIESVPHRRTLTVKPTHDTRRPAPSPMKRPAASSAPKGHEAFLKALETSGAEVVIEKCDATKVKGRIIHSDKYTVSVREELPAHELHMHNGQKTRDRVIFKHDISEFSALTPRVQTVEEQAV